MNPLALMASIAVVIITLGILLAMTFNTPKTPEDRKTLKEKTRWMPVNDDRYYSPKPSTEKKDEGYGKLLLKTLGNRARADGLIELERKRNPKGTKAELIKSAIEQYEYDLRR